MNLKDRLHRLTGESAKIFSTDSRQDKISELRRKIDKIMDRRERLVSVHPPQIKKTAVSLESVIPGTEVETPLGRFFLSRSVVSSMDFHGRLRVGDLACAGMKAAALLSGCDKIAGFSIEDGLFLDTETTGLSGGTGTFPFLIGLGWFENKGLVTCQLFARDFSEEPAMLAYLCELASKRRFLVSFNGKAYDLNLLAARFILNRSKDIFSGMPHIDLLHPSRRIYSHRLENTRLVTLEEAVQGVRRTDDVPGHEIPQRYFDWLRRRDAGPLEPVFQHNRMDVISLASLLKHMTDLVEKAPDSTDAHPADLLAAARLHQERGDLETARRFYEFLACSEKAEIAYAAKRALSLIYKRAGQWKNAVSLWKEMVASDPYDQFAVEELAKWYEHQAREFSPAVEIVQRLLAGSRPLDAPERLAMEHRLRRLRSAAGKGEKSRS